MRLVLAAAAAAWRSSPGPPRAEFRTASAALAARLAEAPRAHPRRPSKVPAGPQPRGRLSAAEPPPKLDSARWRASVNPLSSPAAEMTLLEPSAAQASQSWPLRLLASPAAPRTADAPIWASPPWILAPPPRRAQLWFGPQSASLRRLRGDPFQPVRSARRRLRTSRRRRSEIWGFSVGCWAWRLRVPYRLGQDPVPFLS